MHIFGGGVEVCPFGNKRCEVAVVVHIGGWRRKIQHVFVDEDAALAGFGQNDELVAQIAADGAGFGAHWDGFEAHAGEHAQVSDEHTVI